MVNWYCSTGCFQVVFARWSWVLVAVFKQRGTWCLGNVSVCKCQISWFHCSGVFVSIRF